MIKVLHIGRPISGVGVYISLLTKYIDSTKFRNSIICNKDDKNIELRDDKGEVIKQYHAALKREINIITDFKTLIKIINVIKSVKPEVIHCHSAKAGILGRIAGSYLGIKTYYTPHAYSYLSTHSTIKRGFLKLIERFLDFFPANIIACSNSEFQRAVVELKIKKEKVFVWENSIETKMELKSTEILKSLPQNFICSIGRPSYQKHTALLVEAVKEIKNEIADIHLVILGVGLYSPSLQQIKELIKNYKLEKNITLINWLERPESLEFLNQSKLYVSSSRYEGLPYSLLEAMCLSKPTVVTNVDGNKDLIQNGTHGFVVAEDSLELSNRIKEILNDKKMSQEMSISARKKIITTYDISKNISKIEYIYSL